MATLRYSIPPPPDRDLGAPVSTVVLPQPVESSRPTRRSVRSPGGRIVALDLHEETTEELANAALRVAVKRLLRKHGYPPDKQEKATQTVMEQAEALRQDWVE